MKQSFLLGVLVANLRNIANTILRSQYNDFRVELVEDNFRSAYDVIRGITQKDDEDKFVTKDYYDRIMSCKMTHYAQHVKSLNKEAYLALIKKITDAVIDNAARKEFQMENVDIGVCTSSDDSPTIDDTPGGDTQPPQPSDTDNAKLIKLLRGILNNLDKVIKILEK